LLRRALIAASLAGLLGALVVLAQPAPPPARANVACDVGTVPPEIVTEALGAITGGAVGGGNPVGDTCNAVTDGAIEAVTSPVSGAIEGIGNGILGQITSWVSDGATWLIGQVAGEIEKTTTPKLTSKGFLSEYGRMASIAVLLAAAMVLLAIVEALAQGSWALLGRTVFINLPLAFLATSIAFAVVQLGLVATDGMCHAIAAASHHDSAQFFKSAITGLAKAGSGVGSAASPPGPGEVVGKAVGAKATAPVPLFVIFLAAIVGAFAAFFVWLELLIRDAAVYVVALFMPVALAASIWPRWSGALRRSAELTLVVIASKFVIVSIIALAAGLLAENNGGIEPLLAASALMVLACFAPMILFKLVPFAEGAMGSAYNRRSSAGAGMQLGREAQTIRNMARSNWRSSSPPQVWNVGNEGGPGGGAAAGGSTAAPKGGGGGGKAGGAPVGGAGAVAGRAAGGAAGGAGAGAGGVAAGPVAAAKGSQSFADRLQKNGTAGALSERAGSNARKTDSPSTPWSPGTDSPTGAPEQPQRPPQGLPVKDSPKEGLK